MKDGVISVKAPCLVCRKLYALNIIETRSSTIANYKRHVSGHLEKPKLRGTNSGHDDASDDEQTQQQAEVNLDRGLDSSEVMLESKVQKTITEYYTKGAVQQALGQNHGAVGNSMENSDCEVVYFGNSHTDQEPSTSTQAARYQSNTKSDKVEILSDVLIHSKN